MDAHPRISLDNPVTAEVMISPMTRRWTFLLLAGMLPAAAAQQQPARLTFDVASIRLTDPNTQSQGIKPLDGGHGYTSKGVPIKLVMALMYKVPMRQIEGGPSWFDSDRYDIEARVDGSYSVDDLHTMMKNLLADRFGLKFHTESREGNVYALTVEPGGIKMKPNDTPENDNIVVMPGPNFTQVGTRVPMVYLAWYLGQNLQRDERPVLDLTGLKGFYDFKLSFLPPLPPDISRDTLPPELLEKPSIFDAVRDQLGLKLTAQKGPVDHYVIDHLERPSGN